MKHILKFLVVGLLLSATLCGCDFAKEHTENTAGGGTTAEITTADETVTEPDDPTLASQFWVAPREDGTIEVGYKGNDAHVVVPSEIDGKTVTGLCRGAFYGNQTVCSVLLPDTLQTVGMDAFYDCPKLETVNFPTSLTAIGSSAFVLCKSLREVDIRSDCLNDGSWSAFAYSGLERVVLSDAVSVLPYGIFACTNIKEIDIPGSVKEIDTAFAECKLLSEVTLHEGIERLNGAFHGCDALTEVTVPASVRELNEHSFAECMALETVTFSGNAPEDFYDGAWGCYDSHYTVYYKTDATGFTTPLWNGHLTLPEGGENPARYTDAGLGYLVLDGEVTVISYKGEAAELTVPSEIDGKPVTVIGMDAFVYSEGLVSVTLPDSVHTIEPRAFWCCSNLKSVKLPADLQTLGDRAFDICGLESLTVPASITEWGENCFSHCEELTSVVLEEGLQSIGEGAFAYCYALAEIDVPASVKKLEKYTFSMCALEKVTLHEGLEMIDEYAFSDCGDLKEITIPASVKIVTEASFAYCLHLDSLIFLGDAPEKFDMPAFDDPDDMDYSVGWDQTTVYYTSGAKGFSGPLWCGYFCEPLTVDEGTSLDERTAKLFNTAIRNDMMCFDVAAQQEKKLDLECYKAEFVFMDLDGDGTKEMYIWTWRGDRMILRVEDERVCVYDGNALQWVDVFYEDGRFADDRGDQSNWYRSWWRLDFANGTLQEVEVCSSECINGTKYHYYIAGVEVKKEEYDTYLAGLTDTLVQKYMFRKDAWG